jgi:hypothetical protein
VGGEPGADDQHAVVAQRSQGAAEFEQFLRIQRRHRHLKDRDVRRREHLHQRDVGAVVEPPVRVLIDRPSGCGDELGHVLRQLR